MNPSQIGGASPISGNGFPVFQRVILHGATCPGLVPASGETVNVRNLRLEPVFNRIVQEASCNGNGQRH